MIEMKRTHEESQHRVFDVEYLRGLCRKLSPDEDSTTSAILTLFQNPDLTVDELWEHGLEQWFGRMDTVELHVTLGTGAMDTDVKRTMVIDIAEAIYRLYGFVGIRFHTTQDTTQPFSHWLHHSFVAVDCSGDEGDLNYIVDASPRVGLKCARLRYHRFFKTRVADTFPGN